MATFEQSSPYTPDSAPGRFQVSVRGVATDPDRLTPDDARVLQGWAREAYVHGHDFTAAEIELRKRIDRLATGD